MTDTYAPAPGTKAALAMAALAKGAMSRLTLAAQLAVPQRHLSSQMRYFLAHGLVTTCPVDGVAGYRMTSMPEDQIADVDDAEPPVRHVVEKPSITPTPEAIRWAHPFGAWVEASGERHA